MNRIRRLPLLAGLVALTVLAAACGETRQTSTGTGGDVTSSTGAKTVSIAMQDIKFDQPTLTVTAGETIDFQFTNVGMVAHDAYIGDNAAQMDHEAEMAEMGGGHSDEEEALVLQPGESGNLSYTFDAPGTYQVGCHQPGHYAAGMIIDVTVE